MEKIWGREKKEEKEEKNAERFRQKQRWEREREAGVKGFPFSLSLKHLDSPKSHNQRTIWIIQSNRIDPLAFMNKTY